MFGTRKGVCDIDDYDASANLEAYCDCSGCACYSGGAAPKSRDDDNGDDGDDGASTIYEWYMVLGWGLVFIAAAAVVFGIVRRRRRRAAWATAEWTGAETQGAYTPLGGDIDDTAGPAAHAELTIQEQESFTDRINRQLREQESSLATQDGAIDGEALG